MYFNTANNSLIASIPVASYALGLSLTPDGNNLYTIVGNTASVINTANYSVTAISVSPFPASFGNFISPGGCDGVPATFTITVNPVTPVITATTPTGTISACAGIPSANPNIRQFTVSGNNLTTDITATASTGFEVSLSAESGYSNSITIPQISGAANTVVYVRSSASAIAGSISGNVVLTSTGATSHNVAVSGTVNPLPTVDQPADLTYANEEVTTAVNFTGTANSYTWTNDTPGIGLAASGTGSIPSFKTGNTGSSAIIANITVVPLSTTGCTGVPVHFTITVNPVSDITTSIPSGTITACAGSPSESPNIQQFNVSGSNLLSDITATAPVGFEVSLSATIGYSNSVTISQTNGMVNNTVVYVCSSALAPVGNVSGNVVLTSTGTMSRSVAVTGTVNALPTVDQPVDLTYVNGQVTTAVTFTGTANGYTWTNDNPSIGLAKIGTGNLPSFTAINIGNGKVKANITVTTLPLDGSNCQGMPVAFTITVNPGTSIVIPNVFTPNGDMINDYWSIKNLDTYPNCTVNVYDRYGGKVYSSPRGYGKPWDGKLNGTNLPSGTYYYMIDLGNGDKVFSGYVVIIR